MKNYCIDCNKKLPNRSKTNPPKYCWECFLLHKPKKENHPNWKGGKERLPHCKYCGKRLTRMDCKVCKKCFSKTISGKNHWNYGNTKPKPLCIDCGKQLIDRRSKRCNSCSNKIKSLKHGFYVNGKPCSVCSKRITATAKMCGSCARKHLLFDKGYIKTMMKKFGVTPNKKEKLLIKVLNELLPKEYKFVGNGKFWIENFNPDFINCNGQKKIIEMFGDYWHNKKGIPKRDKQRIKIYLDYGYKTLVVWEHELKDLSKVKNEILEFNQS